jgi:hypothetical protein
MPDEILGHGDENRSLLSLHLAISDDVMIRAIDAMKFDARGDGDMG